MKVLGIESSCDETGVAVYDSSAPAGKGLLAHALYSQVELHAEYGGVVPELASRDHVRKLLPLVRQTLAEAALLVALPQSPEARRPDRDPESCGYDQLDEPVSYDLAEVLGTA